MYCTSTYYVVLFAYCVGIERNNYRAETQLIIYVNKKRSSVLI